MAPPFRLRGMLLIFYFTLLDYVSISLRTIIFRIYGLYSRFQTSPALGLDYRLLPSFSTFFSGTLRTSDPPRPFPLPFSDTQYHLHYNSPLHATIPTPPMHRNLHPNHPQHFRTLQYSPLLSPSPSPMLPTHRPHNPSDFRTSQIPPAPDSLYIPTRRMRTRRLTGDS